MGDIEIMETKNKQDWLTTKPAALNFQPHHPDTKWNIWDGDEIVLPLVPHDLAMRIVLNDAIAWYVRGAGIKNPCVLQEVVEYLRQDEAAIDILTRLETVPED